MTAKKFLISTLFLMITVSGCKKEETIESVPVDEIPTSTPPAYEVPKAEEPVYDRDGVFRIAEKRYFGNVVPFGAEEISCDENECRFYVPAMFTSDIDPFIEKYYPYQERVYHASSQAYEISATIKPEYSDRGIIPGLDPSVVKPTEETAMEIRIFWEKRAHRYQWIYKNPMQRQVFLPTERQDGGTTDAIHDASEIIAR